MHQLTKTISGHYWRVFTLFFLFAGRAASFAQEPTTVIKGGAYMTMKNAKGETLFQIKYVNRYISMTPLIDGFAFAAGARKADILNSKGEVVQSIKGHTIFEAINLGEGVFALKNNAFKWAYYNSEGKQLTGFVYAGAGQLTNGCIRLCDVKTNLCGMIDKTGKQLIPFEYESIGAGFDKNGLVVVGKNEPNTAMKYALMDKELKLKTRYEFAFLHNMSNGQYLYGSSTSRPFYRYSYDNLGVKGVMDRDLRVLTQEIIPAEAYVGFDTAGKRTITWNKRDFTFFDTGKFSPDDGEFEYLVANSRLPEGVDNWRTQDSLGWGISKQLYRIALQKGYSAAGKKMDSLLSDQFYINAHPALKYKQQHAEFNEVVKLAKAGNSESMIRMAGAYLEGSGRPVDTATAINWFSQAVKKVNTKASVGLAALYIDLLNPEEAIRQLKPHVLKDSASRALHDTLNQVGGKEYLMAKAMRVKKNYANAEALFMNAKSQGHEEAGYHLGLMLVNEVDKSRGISALEESAKEGYVPSMMFLGMRAAPWALNENRNSSYFFDYMNKVVASSRATDKQKGQANAAITNARNAAARPQMNPGTVVSLAGVKKVVTLVQADGFYVNGGQYIHAPGLKATAYAPFTILSENNDAYRKTCNSCGGSGKHNKSVVSGTYTTTDVSYRTGSTISGDKKVTTTTTHNNYRVVDEQCVVCSGKGYVF